MDWTLEPKNRVTEAIVRVNPDGEADEPFSGHDLNWYVENARLVVRDGQVDLATFTAWEYIVATQRSED
jgi:hypothetical protein